MTTEVMLDQDPPEVQRVKPIYGYYRKSDGWVTVAVTSPMEMLSYLKEGWTHLPQYGTFDLSTQYGADHPFDLLFQYGGAKEMSVRQVIESGYAINPPKIPRCKTPITQFHKRHIAQCWPAIPVEFPQLKNIKIEKFHCFDETCGRVFPTAEGKKNHETVAHKEERTSTRTGNVLADALAKALKGSTIEQVVSANVPLEIANVGFTPNQLKALQEAGITVTNKKETNNDDTKSSENNDKPEA